MSVCKKCGYPIDDKLVYVDGATYHGRCAAKFSDQEQGRRKTGTVKWYSNEKGYGFILVGGEADDLFFHISEYKSDKPIQNGDKVSFVIGTGKNNKPSAKNVLFIGRTKNQHHEKPYYGKPTYGGFFAELLGVETTEKCMRCGGTGHVTAHDVNIIGFQCGKCKAFWKSRNNGRISIWRC